MGSPAAAHRGKIKIRQKSWMFTVLFFKFYLKNQLMFSVKRSGRRPTLIFLGGVNALNFLNDSKAKEFLTTEENEITE
jgi:hypothetical protein